MGPRRRCSLDVALRRSLVFGKLAPIDLVAQVIEQLLVGRQALPFGPFRVGRDGTRRLDRFPLILGNHADEIADDHDSRRRKLRARDLAGGNERRSQRCRMHHAGMEHARQLHVIHPDRLAGHFGAMDRIFDRLTDDPIGRNRLERRIPGDFETEEAGDFAAHRYRQPQILARDERAIGRRFAAARDPAIADRQGIARYAELARREFERRLARIGRGLAQIARAAEQAEGPAAIRRTVGIAADHGRDRFERDVEFLGDDLPIGSVDRTLPEIPLAGAEDDPVVGTNLDPRRRLRCIELVCR